MKIKALSQDIIDQIAAGEVIQNPASIVKELVENSIDAGAKNIIVEIKDNFISISDDGCGISYEDLESSVQKHTTSKISKLEDIFRISSMGWRGEALFSVVSVAEVLIYSKTKNNQGYKFNVTNGSIEPCACQDGTTIEISNLFQKIPARLKFLKSKHYENNLVEEVIESYAISFKDIIDFTFIKNGKRIKYFNLIHQIFNYSFEDCIEYSESFAQCKISATFINGFTSYKNFLYINKRWIKDKRIVGQVRKAYREITGKEHIGFFIFIECNPESIDFNVHPAKLEVRFAFEIQEIVYIFTHNAFKTNRSEPKQEKFDNFSILDKFIKENNLKKQMNAAYETTPKTKNLEEENITLYKSEDQNVQNKAEDDLTRCNLLHDHIKCNKSNKIDDQVILEEKIEFLGQFAMRYLLFTKGEDIIIIDQHAAHERIVTENLKDTESIQMLVSPMVINRGSFSESHQQEMKNILKVDIEKNFLIVHGVPSFLPDKYLQNFIEKLSEVTSNPKSLIFDFIHEYGCKNSIKTGQTIGTLEAIALYQQLISCGNHQFCNHGRKTTLILNKNKLDNIFGRLNKGFE